MSSKSSPMPDLEDLFRAADTHAADAGDFDHAVGDLQTMLRAAWRAMSDRQRRDFLAQPEMSELVALPEYERLIGDRLEEARS